MSAADPLIEAWVAALIERHTADLARPEFLKAIRALSVRYVQRRGEMTDRSPTDSPGKRAAFAGFFAPLHFFAVRAVVAALRPAVTSLDRIVDLGCGTGVSSAAWALSLPRAPQLAGIDRQRWALDEAGWNWRALGLAGRTRTSDLVEAAERLRHEPRPGGRTGVILGWTVNELDAARRERLHAVLPALASRRMAVLVVEPIARAVAPWWGDWARTVEEAGGHAAERRFDTVLPAGLAALDEAAGFRRDGLSVRTLWLPGTSAADL